MSSGSAASRPRRGPTSTSRFGVGRRESHDATEFYERFPAPTVSSSTDVASPAEIDRIWVDDARNLGTYVKENSVALVVTSPPYFAGKEYETAIGEGHVPASYGDYLDMLHDVFAACVAALEPGGRIAVNVANLGRKPYRSLSSDVIRILQDDLKLLLRGEVIWRKAEAAGGSCAWGTYQRPGNPVLRDLTERVIIASKGRFDRALTAKQRAKVGLPSDASIWSDEFLEATTDVWDIAPESAQRVGHPAPFPVQLPERLIELYTYRDDLVLDPFMGAGSTAVAAVRTERHFVGFDTDADYAARATARVETERNRLASSPDDPAVARRLVLPAVRIDVVTEADPEAGPTAEPQATLPADAAHAQAARDGKRAKAVAEALVTAAGFREVRADVKIPEAGFEVGFAATDQTGTEWFFDLCGAFSASRPGLRRADTLWKAIGKASVLHAVRPKVPFVLLTTNAPEKGSPGDKALRAVLGPRKPIRAVIELLNDDDLEWLRAAARKGIR